MAQNKFAFIQLENSVSVEGKDTDSLLTKKEWLSVKMFELLGKVYYAACSKVSSKHYKTSNLRNNTEYEVVLFDENGEYLRVEATNNRVINIRGFEVDFLEDAFGQENISKEMLAGFYEQRQNFLKKGKYQRKEHFLRSDRKRNTEILASYGVSNY